MVTADVVVSLPNSTNMPEIDPVVSLPNSTNMPEVGKVTADVVSLPNSTNMPEIDKARAPRWEEVATVYGGNSSRDTAAPELESNTVSIPMGPIAHGSEIRQHQKALKTPAAPAAKSVQDTSPPPCGCDKDSSAWRKPTRTTPSCFFFDFGASDGESFRAFLGQSSKWQFQFDTAAFRPHDCFVYLMDPNPKYESDLKRATTLLPTGQAMYLPGSAAYMCEKTNATFYLDVASQQGWGSSLDPEHESVKQTAAKSNIHVSLINILRLLQENTIPSDTVVVKLDIEGAEWDVLPCLANSSAASLIDTLYLESHCEQNRETKMKWCPSNGMAENSEQVFRSSLASLKERGVHVPEYWSPLF
jgi:FkbM family methyltransferase